MTYHHGNLKEALLDAATDLLQSEGPQKLSLRAAARQAGVSQSAPYRHFSAKGDLLAAVGQRGFAQLKKRMLKELSGVADHRQRLRCVGAAYVEFAHENPQLFRLMFGPLMTSENHNKNLKLNCQECYSVLMEVIAEGQAAGVFKTGVTENLAKTAWALVHGFAHLALDNQLQLEPGVSLRESFWAIGGNLFEGLRAPD